MNRLVPSLSRTVATAATATAAAAATTTATAASLQAHDFLHAYETILKEAETNKQTGDNMAKARELLKQIRGSDAHRAEKPLRRSAVLRMNFANHAKLGFATSDEKWNRAEAAKQAPLHSALREKREKHALVNAFRYVVDGAAYLPPHEIRHRALFTVDTPPDERLKSKVNMYIPVKYLPLTPRERKKLLLIAGSKIQQRMIDSRRKVAVLNLACDDHLQKTHNLLSIVQTFHRLMAECTKAAKLKKPRRKAAEQEGGATQAQAEADKDGEGDEEGGDDDDEEEYEEDKDEDKLIRQWRQRQRVRRREQRMVVESFLAMEQDILSKVNLASITKL